MITVEKNSLYDNVTWNILITHQKCTIWFQSPKSNVLRNALQGKAIFSNYIFSYILIKWEQFI